MDARALVLRTAHELLARAPAHEEASLADGQAGFALFFADLAAATGEEMWAQAAQGCLEHALALLDQRLGEPQLLFGFAGVAFALHRLADADDACADLDEALIAELERRPPRDPGLADGAAGAGWYALARGEHPAARRAAELAVASLAASAEAVPGGVAWRAGADHLPEADRAANPRGAFPTGVAHGGAGVAMFLARAAGAGIEGAAALYPRVLGGLLAAERPDAPHRFAKFAGADLRHAEARSAWCSGDLGVAAALLACARAAGDDALAVRALDLARADTARAYGRDVVPDTSLCHGTASRACLCAALGFPAAARRWLDETLARHDDGTPWAGTGLQLGPVGVAAALLADLRGGVSASLEIFAIV